MIILRFYTLQNIALGIFVLRPGADTFSKPYYTIQPKKV